MAADLSSAVADPLAEALVPAPYDRLLRARRRSGTFFRWVLNTVAAIVSFGSARHIALRTRAIDDFIASRVPGTSRQLVILGAGLDSRAWRLAALEGVTVFEIDHPSVQAYKRERVVALSPKSMDVRWVAVDFERDSLDARLRDAGHDATLPTLFLWEGVAMYLTESAIEATLSVIARRCAPGSSLAMSYWEPPEPSLRTKALMILVRSGDEPIRTLIPRAQMPALLRKHGFETMKDEGADTWGIRYRGRAAGGPPERVIFATLEAPV